MSEGYRTVTFDLWFPLMRGMADMAREDCEIRGLLHPRDFRLPMEWEDHEE